MVNIETWMARLPLPRATNNQEWMILPAQLRAARALLGWSREDLAERSGIGAGTIKDFEVEKSDPKQGTVHKWRRALEAAGVEFTEETETTGPGVRLKKQVAKRK
jgi:ribosome-binding protein aMBF1 (putative translation factor)